MLHIQAGFPLGIPYFSSGDSLSLITSMWDWKDFELQPYGPCRGILVFVKYKIAPAEQLVRSCHQTKSFNLTQMSKFDKLNIPKK